MTITRDATSCCLKYRNVIFLKMANSPRHMEITQPKITGTSPIMKTLKIEDDGVKRVNSELDEKQSIENTAFEPEPTKARGANMLVNVIGKSRLYAKVVVIH
mmetsp:Transcript_17111/g.19736  ORF Transcript_17111/g.19736 Transcript_17111/m.19736 type:complete len:102 (-) Transcript_17111:42-347(-)